MTAPIVTVANGITLFRLVLFAGFIWMLWHHDLPKATVFFILAWGLDFVDGLAARALHQVSALGSLLDKVVDRTIIGLGVLFLIRTNFLPPEALLILTKDIALLPALTFHALRREPIKEVGGFGKMMTTLQGASVVWILLDLQYTQVVIAIVGIVGAGVAYRHLRDVHTT